MDRSVRVGLLSCIMVVAAGVVTADDGDAIVGPWLTAESDEGRARVEVVRDGDTYGGAIVWLEEPVYPPDDEQGMGGLEKIDRENPDPALRSRPTIGIEVVSGFRYAGDNTWKDGTIYDPETGKTYRCKAHLNDDGSLKVRGFVGISLLGRTTVWTRIQEPAPAASD